MTASTHTKVRAPVARRLTICDIAAACHVSRQVVSAIMSDRPSRHVRFSEETRAEVLSAAHGMGYRPNRTIANFRRRRHRCVGLLVHDLNFVPTDILKSMIGAAHEHDHLLVVEQMDGRGGWPKLVREDCVDGLVLFETVAAALREEIRRCRIPMVEVNTNRRRGPDRISFAEQSAVELAVEAFVRRGRRQPAFVLPAKLQGHFSETARLRAFRRAARAAGLRAPHVFRCADAWQESCEHTREFLATHPAIDGILLYYEGLVSPVYGAAMQLGRQIPRDISVIGFNDTYLSKAVWPHLTTLSVDSETVGRNAVQLLERIMLSGENGSGQTLNYELHMRDSV